MKRRKYAEKFRAQRCAASNLKQQIAVLSGQLNEKAKEVEQITKRSAANEAILAKSLEKLRIKDAELTHKNQELEAQHAEILAQNEELSQTQEELMAQREFIEQQKAELERNNHRLKANEAILAKSLEKLRTKDAELTRKNQEMEAQHAEILAQNEELSQTQEELMAQREFIEQQKAELERNNQRLKANEAILGKSLEKLKAKDAELTHKNQELEAQHAEILAQNEELSQTQEELMAQREFIEQQKAELERNNHRLKANEAILAKSLEKLRTKDAELTHKNQELEAQHAEILAQNEELSQTQEELMAQREFIEQQKAELERNNQRLKANEAILGKSLEKLKAKEAEVQQKNAELAIRNAELQAHSFKITTSIRAAYAIQHALLPYDETAQRLLGDHFVIYRPKDIVSGDFWWLDRIEGHTFVAVIDCTGHGVAGAFVTMIANILLDKIIALHKVLMPAAILEQLHQDIQEVLQQRETRNDYGMDMSIFRLTKRQDQTGHDLLFAGAKQNAYIVQDGELCLLKGDRKSIGGQQGEGKTFSDQYLHLKPGSWVYGMTDGILDQNDAQRKNFGTKRMQDFVRTHHHLPPAQQKQALERLMSDFMGTEEQRDDMTFVAFCP